MSELILRFRPTPDAYGDPSPELFRAAVLATLDQDGLIAEDPARDLYGDVDRFKRLGAAWDVVPDGEVGA